MALLRRFTAVTCPDMITASIAFTLLVAGAASAQQTAPHAAPVTPAPPLETPPNPPAAIADGKKNEASQKRLRFGPQIGFYLPSSKRAQDRFGKTWSNIGFGIGNISDIHRDRRLALDISFISNSRGDAKIFLAPIGLAYSIGLGDQTRSTAAYTGISANLVVASLRSDRDRLPTRTSATGGASAFLGTRFGESAYIEARYNALGKIRGFDLSGFNLTAGYRF